MYLLLNVPRMPSVDLYNLYWAHLKDFLVCKEELILFRTRGGGKTICFGRKRDRQNHPQELYYSSFFSYITLCAQKLQQIYTSYLNSATGCKDLEQKPRLMCFEAPCLVADIIELPLHK